MLNDDVPLALDVLATFSIIPPYDPDELAREQHVILQEIGATEDTPDDRIFDHLPSLTFPDQPLGRSILGTPEPCAVGQPKLAPISRAIIGAPRW